MGVRGVCLGEGRDTGWTAGVLVLRSVDRKQQGMFLKVHNVFHTWFHNGFESGHPVVAALPLLRPGLPLDLESLQ